MQSLTLKFLLLILLSTLGAKELIIGTNATYRPFEFIDSDNKIAGFDIDLLEAMSKKLDFKYRIVDMSFDGLIPALISGKIDAAISAMSATPQRLRAVAFTAPYYKSSDAYVKRKDSALDSKNALSGKKVAFQIGSTQEQSAKKIKGATLSYQDDINSALLALTYGKVDAVIMDSASANKALEVNKKLTIFDVDSSESLGFSIAFGKNKHKELVNSINQALEQMAKNGELEALYKKWELK